MKQAPRNQSATAKPKRSSAATTVVLSGELTVGTVTAAHAQLEQALAQAASALTVDLTAVESIDTAGLQLLLYSKSQSERLDKEFKLANISEPVKAYLQRFNVATTQGALL